MQLRPRVATAAAPNGAARIATRAQASQQPVPSTTQDKALKLVGPEPKRFTVAEGQLLSIASAAVSAIMRAGSGGFVAGYKAGLVPEDGKYAVASVAGRSLREESTLVSTFPRPAKPVVLYEFEGCPFCRKVREAVAILDLDVLFLPCPKGGSKWRQEAIAKGGKAQFPYMVDENTGTARYESDDIIRYLFNRYGNGQVPLLLRLGFITTLTCGLALAPRGGKGSRASPSRQPQQPLTYWGYEMSPFCKVVREVLSEMELPHVYRTVARGSPKRQQLLDKYGHFQVPFIEDPNTGEALFESKAIIEYLRKTYGQ